VFKITFITFDSSQLFTAKMTRRWRRPGGGSWHFIE